MPGYISESCDPYKKEYEYTKNIEISGKQENKKGASYHYFAFRLFTFLPGNFVTLRLLKILLNHP